ncbi:allatostatins MIP isoform X2 [Episyrphus balteatus]|uniref:allatostatins MIP isoform X2 n=1 Tax=Episyrphus balteatus TaxID=286459 RepID=UPI0024857DCC|nr:allatostatins MIP isoform X2 [Episyrphus balteatus]
MVQQRTSLQKQNQLETRIRTNVFLPHLTNLRLLHLLAVAFLSAHFGLFVNAESKELFDNVNPQRRADNDNDKFIDDVDASDIMDKLKRSWKSLQGSWGKRSDDPNAVDYYENEPEWTLVKASENSRESELEPETETEPEAMKYFVLYASNPNNLAETIGATSTNNLPVMGDNLEEEPTASNFEKKSWKNMNVAWGKRRSAVWNKFRGAWGKREPAWNNLKGMWGKRSTKDWKKLQSAWGKRSQQQKDK